MNQHRMLIWTGRISGILVTLFFGAFFIGEGWPDIKAGKGQALLQFLPYSALSFFGFFVAWTKPSTGGWILLAGAAVLFSYFMYQSNWAMAFVYGIPPLLVGLCFLAAANKQMI